jgi:predicted enzyme related to lactoylglutathione lyase
MGNPVAHFEIGATDTEPLARFHGELFGWTTSGGAYGLVDADTGTGMVRDPAGDAFGVYHHGPH